MARRSSGPHNDTGAGDSLRSLLDAEDQLTSRLVEKRLEAQRILEDAREQVRVIEAAAGEQRATRLDAMNTARAGALQAEIERTHSQAQASAEHFDSIESSMVEELASFLVSQVLPAGDGRREGPRR